MIKIVTDRTKLHSPCRAVSLEEGHEIGKVLLREMALHGNCIGLAAPQIGIDARVFASKYSGEKPFDKECYFVNLEILDQKDPKLHTEGCLSIPGKFVDKIRWNSVLIKDDVNPMPRWIDGLPAAIIQHENDHTLGILMDDEQFNIYVPCPCGSGLKFKFCHLKKKNA